MSPPWGKKGLARERRGTEEKGGKGRSRKACPPVQKPCQPQTEQLSMEEKLRHKDITAGERNPQIPDLDRTAESEQQQAKTTTEVKTSKDPAGYFFYHFQLMILVLGFWGISQWPQNLQQVPG